MTAVHVANGRLSASGHAHMARDGGLSFAAIDNKVVAFRLVQDGGIDRGIEEIVALGGAQRRAQIGSILLPEAHVKRAGAGEPHAVAGFAKVMCERCDETEPPA